MLISFASIILVTTQKGNFFDVRVRLAVAIVQILMYYTNKGANGHCIDNDVVKKHLEDNGAADRSLR
jgi:hypothetical protein